MKKIKNYLKNRDVCYNSSMNKQELRKRAQELPHEPGVYLMYSEVNEVIYVGKAKNLKNRVSQYFDNQEKQIKVSNMVQNVHHFDFIITKSESDAFALECNLIKKYKPKYNILLKDDKNFPYIVLNKNQLYPTFSVTRKVKNDGRTYFGPFVTYIKISTMLEIINSAFLLPTCSRKLEKLSKRCCIEGDMGRCAAPCIRRVSPEEYQKQLGGAIDFLRGKTGKIKQVLKQKMIDASEKEDYENAAKYRDQLTIVKKAEERVLTNLPKSSDLDLFALIEQPEKAVVVQFLRGGKLTGQKIYNLEEKEGTTEELLQSFVGQFYESKESLPGEILVSHNIVETINKFFSENYNKNIEVICPTRGLKKDLINNAVLVAQKYIAQNRQKFNQEKRNTEGALSDLQEVLSLPTRPWRLECYDISNTYGTNSVASMVVFEGGVPAKKMYRKFKIKTIEGANDFGSMAEVMRRRFTEDESFGRKPDIVVIDGGLGQLHAAEKILRDLGEKVIVISLAKKEELIFTTKSDQPIALLKNEPALKLLQRLRDEAHRFAITYHRTLRNKKMFE